MARRRPITRGLSLVLAVLFALASGARAWGYRCAARDGIAPRFAQPAAAAHQHHAHGSSEHGSNHGDHRNCICMGPCHAGPAVATQLAVGVAFPVAVHTAPSPVSVATESAGTPVPHLLPFAHAPPRLA